MRAPIRRLAVVVACLLNFCLFNLCVALCGRAAIGSGCCGANSGSALEAAVASRRHDLRRDSTLHHLPDCDHAAAGRARHAGCDSSRRTAFPRGRGNCRCRAGTSSHDSRVGRRVAHASPDDQRPAHFDLLISAQSSGPDQPGRRLPRAGRSRPEWEERVEGFAKSRFAKSRFAEARCPDSASDRLTKRIVRATACTRR